MSDLARAKAILADLVAMPTLSAESNLDAVAYARSLLEPLGARIRITPDPSGAPKANLLATIGPEAEGGVILSGHLDVVPVAGQAWRYPPFALTEAMGRLYGRGTADMKGFVACALAMAPAFAAAPLARPVHIALTHDEEVGCLGAPALIADLLAAGPRPAACIVGEPTGMAVVEGHKGCFEYTTRFEGLEGHGSRPDRAVSAIDHAVLFVRALMAIGAELRQRAPAESRFDPPWSTISVGRIEGGTARNTVAGSCAVEWEFRPVCAADADLVRRRVRAHCADVLLPAMRAVHPGAAIVTEVVGEVPGLAPDPASPAVTLAARLTGRAERGLVAFGTEAGLFQAAGIPAVVCGPGSIGEAHRPDEFIAPGELDACLGALHRLVATLAA